MMLYEYLLFLFTKVDNCFVAPEHNLPASALFVYHLL